MKKEIDHKAASVMHLWYMVCSHIWKTMHGSYRRSQERLLLDLKTVKGAEKEDQNDQGGKSRTLRGKCLERMSVANKTECDKDIDVNARYGVSKTRKSVFFSVLYTSSIYHA